VRALTLAVLATLLLTAPAFGQQVPVPGSWQPGPGATGDNTYVGAIDAPANGSSVPQTGVLSVSGWFVDTTAQGWTGADDVQLFLGTMDTGKLLGRGAIGLNRPDVGAALGNPVWSAAGWQVLLDVGSLQPGTNTLSVYAHTPAKGWWSLAVTVTVGQAVSSTGEMLAPAPALQGGPPVVTIAAPSEDQIVSTRIRAFPITGTAREATTGARGIDWVEVWLNGEASSDTGVILGVADLSSDGSWSLPFDPGAHEPLNSNLYVYAHSAVNGKTSLVVRHFFLADRPLQP
jgi:hypothetical protein